MNTNKRAGALLILFVFLGGCQAGETLKDDQTYNKAEDFLINDEENLLPLRKSQRPQVILIPSKTF